MIKGYYFVTDSALSRAGNISDVKSALASGVKVVQYREKSKPGNDMYNEALLLRKLCERVIFLVNDRVDIAIGSGADGVHLGREDIPYEAARRMLGEDKIIGLTARTFKEAVEAQGLGADYIGVGPVFGSRTKPEAGEPVGTGLIKKIKENLSIPVIAIGGIGLLNAKEAVMAGADGICAVSAVVTKPDVRSEIRKFQELFGLKGQAL